MNLAAKITYPVSALVIAGLVALAVPALDSIGQAAHTAAENTDRVTGGPTEPAAEPTPYRDTVVLTESAHGYVDLPAPEQPAVEARTPNCNSGPHLYTAGLRIDTGAVYGATGTANYDAEGRIASYTVAPNDSLVAIGERFCMDYALILDTPVDMIHPGDILTLR